LEQALGRGIYALDDTAIIDCYDGGNRRLKDASELGRLRLSGRRLGRGLRHHALLLFLLSSLVDDSYLA
jgi:hypothetical protein